MVEVHLKRDRNFAGPRTVSDVPTSLCAAVALRPAAGATRQPAATAADHSRRHAPTLSQQPRGHGQTQSAQHHIITAHTAQPPQPPVSQSHTLTSGAMCKRREFCMRESHGHKGTQLCRCAYGTMQLSAIGGCMGRGLVVEIRSRLAEGPWLQTPVSRFPGARELFASWHKSRAAKKR